MLPGYIAGFYRREQCFINLPKLAARLRIAWRQGRAVAVKKNHVVLTDGERVEFDALSINCGAHHPPPFAAAAGIAVKPIGAFINRLESAEPFADNVAVIGAGAGGVETAFALKRRFGAQCRITLIGDALLPGLTDPSRAFVADKLRRANIPFIRNTAVAHTDGKIISAAGDIACSADAVVFATPAAPPAWLRRADLALSERGFVAVCADLRSVSSPRVFAAGDIADHPDNPPKSGVMAVRQAPILAHNLLVAAGVILPGSDPPRAWRKSPPPLYIIGAADGDAVASIRGRTFAGKWVWRWKQYLDQKFMRKFA